MLTEYLAQHPLSNTLTREGPFLVPPLEDRDAWNAVPEAYREEILTCAAQYAPLPYPMRKATDFLAFVRSGSRKADEDPYFFRRRKLCYAALACCLGETQYLDDVVDGVWCVCEETSWVISAHNVNPIPGAPSSADFPLPDAADPYIDLFSAQTGMILALILRMLRSKLDAVSPELSARITRELEVRILRPFLSRNDFWWMGVKRKDLNNWTPWILSNILVVAFAQNMIRADLEAVLERACAMLDRWLDTVPEDGGCDEGAGYWNMAGGALLDCLQLLEDATGGRMRLWDIPKVRNILAFPAKAEIANGWFLNFADCDARPFLSGERIQTAGEKTGNPALVSLGNRLRGKASAELSDVPHFIRMIRMLFHPAADPSGMRPAESSPGDVWLPDLQVRVLRRDGLTLCAKGGHNGESHNHNDVGSFMLFIDGEPEIVDAGNMTYTAQTFSDRRYELWNTRSAWHNVPLIHGREQLPGAAYRAADVRCLSAGLSLELANAYDPAAGLVSFVREMRLENGAFVLHDTMLLHDPGEISWTFLFRNPPENSGDGLRTDRLFLPVPAGFRVEIEEKKITDPRMARNYPGSLWRVTLTDAPALRHEGTWCLGRRSRV